MSEAAERMIQLLEKQLTELVEIRELLRRTKAWHPVGTQKEVEALFPADPSPEMVAARILISGGGEFPVTKQAVAKLQDTYPDVDVARTLAEIRMKQTTGSVRRPTVRGAPRFIGDWIHREQNIIVNREARTEQYRGNGGRKA